MCHNCAGTVALPSSAHYNHRFRVWNKGLWFDVGRHVFRPTTDPPADSLGAPWVVERLDTLNLGLNAIADPEVLKFNPRQFGELRLALMNVPAGNWDVRIQLSTWPSPYFGEAEIKMLRTTKKWSVQTGMTSIGYVDFFVGAQANIEDYVDRGAGNPTTVCNPVSYFRKLLISHSSLCAWFLHHAFV